MKKTTYEGKVGGKEIKVTLSDLADQTNGSVLVQMGNTIVLVTACMSEEAKEGTGFFPLTVDYEEKFYASGQILGSRFQRREGKPSDEAVLSGRIVDRTIRPLFDQRMRHEVQVVVTILSIEKEDPDTLAVIGASLALGISDIPWGGPVSAVRIGAKQDGSFVINPSYDERGGETAYFDMVACGKDGNINMIEVGSKEVSPELFKNALEKANEELETLQKFQKEIIKKHGKKKADIELKGFPKELEDIFEKTLEKKLGDIVMDSSAGKSGLKDVEVVWQESVKDASEEAKSFASDFLDEKINNLIHKEAVESGKRADGRAIDEVRPLFAEAGGLSPILHGSGVFYRGGTHVLSVVTLGGPQDSQIIDGMELQETKRFMHHYNFPPFSGGETGRMGGTNRRMIGHGALAEKALSAVIPAKETFPYTIRVVSESMASNGSTSMASVCASTLALMDAGVPISSPVVGIAMGLMSEGKKHVVLTDIQGPEDHHGDMDFKVAGTAQGITAIQLDVKVDGIPLEVLAEATEKARKAHETILKVITKAIDAPRKNISPYAPEILSIKIKQDQIGMVIGPGGKMVKGIKEKTGADIDIEDDGTVFITGKAGSAEKAKAIIEEMTHEYVVGEKMEGEVTKVAEFGAFVKIGDNTEGLVHVSEMANFRIEDVAMYIKIGDKVPVVVKGIDEKKRISLSIKQASPDFIKKK